MGWITRAGNKIRSWVTGERSEDQFIPLEEELPRSPLNERATINAIQVMRGLGQIILSRDNVPRIAASTTLTVLSTGLNFLSPYLFALTIDALRSETEEAEIGGYSISKEMLIALMITSYSLGQLLPNWRDQVLVPVTNNNIKRTLAKSTDHLLNISLSSHITTPFPDRVYFLQKSFALGTAGVPIVTQIAPTLVEICIACSVLSARYGVEVGAGIAVLISVYIGYGALAAKPLIQSRENMLTTGNKSYLAFVNAINNYKNMRDFGHYELTMEEVLASLNDMRLANNKGEILGYKINQGYIALSRLTMFLAALYIGSGVQSKRYSTEDFVILLSYLNQLSILLPNFGSAINQLFASWPDLKFVLGELAIPDEVVDEHPDVPLDLNNDEPIIEFNHVSYSYKDKSSNEEVVLFKDLSFTVEKGQTVALVSASGAGKTTIFNLLYRYYSPNSGSIKIYGQDIQDISLRSLQSNITLFSQTANLFNGTVRDNIVYGATHPKEIDDAMIWDVAQRAGLTDFLRSLSKQLDTDVGEDGKALSGGQQQKVALLRGLMKNSEIHLMDEITASLDSQSATQILRALEEWPEQRTRLMISHKLSEVKDSDLIIVLDEGKVIAQGRHDFLLETCSLYQQLWTANNTLTSTSKILQSLGGSVHVEALEPELMPYERDGVEFKVNDRTEPVYESDRTYEPPM